MKTVHITSIAVATIIGLSVSACSSSSSSDNGSGSGSGSADAGGAALQIVLVEGKLAKSAADTQATHDSIFGGFKDQSAALGNIGHSVFVDVSTGKSMLNVDSWDNPAGLQQFLSNPDVQKVDAQLFVGQPTVNVTTLRAGWAGWGKLSRTLPDGTPAVVALIRGTLASDPATAMGQHNQFIQSAQPNAVAAGDQAHVVLEDPMSPASFLAIDVWASAAAATALYGSADFQKSNASLLAGAPTVTLYAEQTWVQWP